MHVFVFSSALSLVGIVESYQSLEWERRFARPGTVRLRVNRNATHAKDIAKKGFIGIHDGSDSINRIYQVEQIETLVSDAGRASEMVEVSGRDVSGMFTERACLPPGGSSHDTQGTSVAAETAMKHYVSDHAGPTAAVNRRLTGLVIAADQGRGGNLPQPINGRFQTISELLSDISALTDVGYETDFNPSTNQHIFDVIVGTDRTASVFLDIDFDTVRSQRWLTSDLGTKNYAVVGGQGVGTARTIVNTFLGGAEPTGFNRHELFVDARDTNDSAALTGRGKAKLEETGQDDAFETDINQFGSFSYPEDFDLGDLVTVRNTAWNISQAVRVLTVTSVITPDMALPRRAIELARAFPTLKDRIGALSSDGSARE